MLARLMDAVDPALADKAPTCADRRWHGRRRRGPNYGIRWIGHRLHAEAEVTVDGDLSVAAAHRISEDARHRLLHEVPRLASAILHADPCGHDGVDHHADLEHHDLEPGGEAHQG